MQEMTLKYEQSVAEVRAKQEAVRAIKAMLEEMENDLQKTRSFIDKL